MSDSLSDIIDELQHNLNKSKLKEYMKNFDFLISEGSVNKIPNIDELYNILENKLVDKVYVIKKSNKEHVLPKLYCDEIKTEVIKSNDKEQILKFTMPVLWLYK